MGSIKLKASDEIEKMRVAGRITGAVLAELAKAAQAGISTAQLDALGEKLIRAQGADPVFLGYRGYKHATCISINQEVVHGIPGERRIMDGDLVSIDVGVKKDGYCGDSALTVPVGKVGGRAEKLLRTAKQALTAGIKQARAGNHLGDIGAAVQQTAEKQGFSVVRDLYGHGIGRELHEDPLVPNFGKPGEGPELKPGMILAIEPMLNVGGWRIRTLADGWTVVTEDGSLSCHVEHTVLITDGEPEILTWSKTKT
jgi:methionyl aminopeptidase